MLAGEKAAAEIPASERAPNSATELVLAPRDLGVLTVSPRRIGELGDVLPAPTARGDSAIVTRIVKGGMSGWP